ncbi:hypothetical protein ACHQM5_027338 [Ranunculus cassubicifolius]
MDMEEEEVQKDVIENKVEEGAISYICLSVLPTSNTPSSTYFYALNPNTEYNEYNYKVETLKPVAQFPSNECIGFGTVSLNSKLYIIGGEIVDPNNPNENLPVKDVYVFDTDSPSTGWVKAASMKSGKSFPKIVPLDGKIYVIGCSATHGYIEDAPKPWGEVYDPVKNSWSDLPKPPVEVLQDGWIDGYAVLEKEEKILISMHDGGSFVYSVKNKSWTKVESPGLSKKGAWSGRAAVVGDVMYSYYHGKVYGYDLSLDKWLEGPVMYLEDLVADVLLPDPPTSGYDSPSDYVPPKELKYLPPDAIPSGFVVNVGMGNLCLVWSSQCNEEGHRLVYCLMFKPTKFTREDGNSSLVTARVVVPIPNFKVGGELFDDCFPV